MRFYKEEMKSLRTNTCYISLNIFWTALRHITKNKGGCSGEENLNFCVRENFLTVWDPKRMYSLALSFQFSRSIMSNSLQHHGLHLAQTHVHWVSDAIQPPQPLLSSSSPAFNLSHHQGLFQGVSSLHQGAKVLELQLQHQSFQWIFRTDFL